ncbi:MAG: ATP-binding protein [Candidatus Onthomonas sp.]
MILIVALVGFCCVATPQDAIYCAACGYATQHFSALLYSICCLFWLEGNYVRPPRMTPLSFIIKLLVYLTFYFLFARRMGNGEGYLVDTRQSVFSVVLILAAVLVLSLIKQHTYGRAEHTLYLVCNLYDMLFCFVILWNQVSQIKRDQLQRELAFQQHLSRQQQEQYAITRETIDIINRKCHDMKHQIAALRYLQTADAKDAHIQEIEDSIQIYDSTLQTGSEVLDTVLTEKSLYCEAHQITLTCVADGSQLSFLDPIDLYTIFGNALDNAIESVSQLANPEQRIIAVSIWAKNGLVMIQMENYYEGSLTMQDGLPITSKGSKEDHGFGLKSIRITAAKYDGHMTLHTEGQLFILRISFPFLNDAETH